MIAIVLRQEALKWGSTPEIAKNQVELENDHLLLGDYSFQ